MKTLFMETTKVSAEQSAHQIQALLVAAGARQVLTEYDAQREIIGIHFILSVNNQHVPFKMPVRSATIMEHLKSRKTRRHYGTRASKDDLAQKAKRIAWRQLLRWIEAQLAFIEAGMAASEEVFMPYIEIKPGVSLYTHALESKFAGLLPASVDHG